MATYYYANVKRYQDEEGKTSSDHFHSLHPTEKEIFSGMEKPFVHSSALTIYV
jgi:hypothetical protein